MAGEAEQIKKVLVIFGSKSDAKVYDEITKELEKAGVEFELKTLSAHRNPEEVKKAVTEFDYNAIIAGAGLSAALPGVIASHTVKPVIGVPCDGAYQGLDALLSIMQMPPGIPVMGVGVNNSKMAARAVVQMLKQYDYINIVGDTENKRVLRARDMMEQFDQEFKVQDEVDKDAINIKFVELGQEIDPKEAEDALVIYCPLHEESTAEAALSLLKISANGLWVGLNRGDNAAVAALEIINMDDRHEETFHWYRDSLKKPKEGGK